MKNRTTLVLLISILLVGGYIWMQEAWRSRMPSKEYRRLKLFELDADTLVSVQFQYTNAAVICVKENGTWMAGGSEQDLGRADIAMVQRMVAGLNSIVRGTAITARHLEMRGLKRSEYGFDQPSLVITAVDNKGRHEWVVGRKTPLGDMVYLREDDKEDIFTVSDNILFVSPVQADQLRDRTLFAGDSPGVRRVEVRGPTGFVQILKDLQTGWHIQQPLSAPADAAAVERYIDQLFGLRIEEFVEENVSDFSAYGLLGDRQISIGGVEGTSRMLILGDAITDQPGVIYARSADDTSVFSLKSEVLDYLNVSADHFRNADVLSLAPEEISLVSMVHDDSPLEMTRDDDGKWQITKPVMWPAETGAVVGLLKLWEAAVITTFDVPAPSTPIEWSMTFGSRELAQTNTVSIFSTAGKKDGLLIRRGADRAVYQINLPLIPDAMMDPLHYKDREIWRFERQDIQRVSLCKNGAAAQVIEQQEDGSFASAGLLGQPDPAAIEKMLNNITNLRATDYVSHNPRELGIYGLDAPALELQVSLNGADELGRVLLVGRETREGFYSMVKGRDVVFYLSKRLIDSLSL